MWNHLSRLKMGIGMRGPGEKQLEVDRRLVEKRIHELQTELKVIERRRERQVAAINQTVQQGMEHEGVIRAGRHPKAQRGHVNLRISS